jgi:hypothetical protein
MVVADMPGPSSCPYLLQVFRCFGSFEEGYAGLSLYIRHVADHADLVQDLYINQLKAYKPAPQVRLIHCPAHIPNQTSSPIDHLPVYPVPD